MKRIAILQSNYIPWKGYFDIINSVDEFVIYDDAQYTKRDWRNRNLIKTKDGLLWLTIPVKSRGRYTQKICETEIASHSWTDKHFDSLRFNYKSSLYFDAYCDFVEGIYLQAKELRLLSEVNRLFISKINLFLGINTKISLSHNYSFSGGSNEKIIQICKQCGAGEYLTGPAAKAYLDPGKLLNNDIKVVYMDYSGYPEYRQLFGTFHHYVSIIDLIFNEGPDAQLFMKSF
jgi:hypothetical protein